MPQVKQGLTRCAVCKIDLKGKFVFIDEQIEQLFGYSKENLFGKPLHDFLDKNSALLLDEILNVRNNYETFYDTTTLNFLNKENQLFSLKVIITLNFIAGNPVNFQLIIDTVNTVTGQKINQENAETDILSILSNVNTETLSDTNLLLEYFHSLSQSKSTSLYIANENHLDLVATTDSVSSDDAVEKTLADTSAIHIDYAESGKIYSFLNDQDVSKAIEKYKQAPDEFLLPLYLASDFRCLLRMKYDQNYSISSLQKVYNQVQIAISFVEKILAVQNDFMQDSGAVDIKFTIGFLESINIPAFLTDIDGEIIGYNPSMKKLFSEKLLSGGYFNLFKSIEKYNNKPVMNSIVDYVNSPFEPTQPTEKQFSLHLNKSISKKLSVLKIGDKETDRTACFVFVPK